MSIFQCENCGCAENTTSGRYHTRYMDIWAKEDRGQKLCSVCAPTTYADGSKVSGPNRHFGKCHDGERLFLPKGQFITNRDGNLVHRDTGNFDCHLGRNVEYPDLFEDDFLKSFLFRVSIDVPLSDIEKWSYMDKIIVQEWVTLAAFSTVDVFASIPKFLKKYPTTTL